MLFLIHSTVLISSENGSFLYTQHNSVSIYFMMLSWKNILRKSESKDTYFEGYRTFALAPSINLKDEISSKDIEAKVK